VDEREFFERWDRRDERWDHFITRSDELMREIRNEVALTREEVALTRKEVELTREEVRLSREQRQRSDAMMERFAAEHVDLREFIREMTARIERSGREMSAELRDLREESRAHRSALLKLIDRMSGPQPGGAAGAA
jgi:hypothetical protein